MNPCLILRARLHQMCELSRQSFVILSEMTNSSWTSVETIVIYKKISAKTNFTICLFNINGTKDKDVSIDEKLENFIVLFLQKHLLPLVSLNYQRRSNKHLVFFSKSARKTSGRP